jgi:hypothetical protein
MQLESESVTYDSEVDPSINLRACGATNDECAFLVRGQPGRGWTGERVELNAMTSGQFIAFVEQKLQEVGVAKVVPDQATLAKAYRRAWHRAIVQDAIDTVLATASSIDVPTPPELEGAVRAAIENTAAAWDDAIWELVRTHRQAQQ